MLETQQTQQTVRMIQNKDRERVLCKWKTLTHVYQHRLLTQIYYAKDGVLQWNDKLTNVTWVVNRFMSSQP